MINRSMTELQKKGYELERLIVEKLWAYAEEMGMNQVQVSKLAFDDGDGSRWRRIRNTSRGGKPQRLTLSDALAVAAAIGVTLDRIMVEVEVDLKNQAK